jgi:hypothetical protein
MYVIKLLLDDDATSWPEAAEASADRGAARWAVWTLPRGV